jgi:HEAT repeat protein
MNRYLPLIALLFLGSLLNAQPDDKKKKDPGLPDGLKALQHPDASVRYRAVETLGKLGATAKFAIPELREALKDKNAAVRVKVAEALWKIEQPPASVVLPVLMSAMTEKDQRVRAQAPPVIALLGTKAKPAVPLLVAALKDSYVDVKLAAITALGDLGPVAKDAVGPLLDLADDADFFLLEPFVGAALGNLGDSVTPTLAKALRGKSADRRRVAAYALGSMGAAAEPAAGELAKALKNNEPATRKLAARALGRIGPKAMPTLPQLEAALADKDVTVRIEAALATFLISNALKHVGVLVKALEEESVAVREAACQALAAMKSGARVAVDPVAKLLGDKELRIRAIITLGEIGPDARKTVPTLTKLLTDKDSEAQLWSAYALWQITGETKESLPLLEKMLGSELHDNQAIQLITNMGPAARDALPTLVAIYREEENLSFRQALAVAIKKIDPESAKKLGIR